MNTQDFLRKDEKMKQLSHLRNLIALAITDGTFDQSEKDLIQKIGLRSGLGKDEIERINNSPQEIRYIAPSTLKEKMEQLYDMVNLIMINKELQQNELSLCKVIGSKLGLDLPTLNFLIPKLINSISNELPHHTVIATLMKELYS